MAAETTSENTAAGRGRPRLTRPRRPGTTAREQILDAAAELFTNHGYASTSTRRIADEVGVRQASLYHHFATKDDILDALLAGTVDEALRLGTELLDGAGPAVQRLHTLAVADAHQLCAGRWNLGALYLLPELRTDRFEPFRQRRAELREVYRRLSEAVISECDGPPDSADLPFRLVESVVNSRSDDAEGTPAQPWVIAEAALRMLGFVGDFRPLVSTTAARLGCDRRKPRPARVRAVTEPTYEAISFEQSGAVAYITLNRPDAANGMNDTMTRELADAARRCDTPATKAVVLTGAGRFFCAGGDLKSFATAPDRGRFIKGVADDLHQAISSFARMDAVLITAVNGTAAGAGFSLAVTGDLVLAAEPATFTMAYTKVGLSPDGSASYHLPRLVGLRRAQELILTNRTLSAAEAQEWGLVTEVVAADDLATRAAALAEQVAAGSGGSNGAVKSLLVSSFKNSLEEQMAAEGRFIAERANSADGREGVDAFLAKRKPDFA